MTDSSLIGVALGGFIGIAGSVIGPLILEWRKQLYARRHKRRDKLEELASLIYEHHHWVQHTVRSQREGSRARDVTFTICKT